MLRVLNRHLLWEFIRSFLITAAVLTLVMYVGATVQAIDYMSRGISGLLILKIFTLNVPFTLSFVIPVSVLTTVLLQFGRLSADGEITALKACGVSLWQIAAPIVFGAVLLSGLCLFINAEIAPRSHYLRYKMLRELGAVDPLGLLEEGRFTSDFPGVKIYVGKKSGARLEDIVLFQFAEMGARAEVRARSGRVRCDVDRQTMDISANWSAPSATSGRPSRTSKRKACPACGPNWPWRSTSGWRWRYPVFPSPCWAFRWASVRTARNPPSASAWRSGCCSSTTCSSSPPIPCWTAPPGART